jgi:arylformamidase
MIYDISPLISSRLSVWPGDTPPSRQILMDMKKGDAITLSTLQATVHLGAHADAPCHYGLDTRAIHQQSLDFYLGPCQVIRLSVPRGELISPDMVKEKITTPRILLATATFPDPEIFNKNFAALTPELVECLHNEGVKLIGVDTPSVDSFSSKDLPVHKMILKHDMAILEGLVLGEVPQGTYELIALPLKLKDFDASPVRAVLRTLPPFPV